MRISTMVSKIKGKYQNGTHDWVRISTEIYMIKWECNQSNKWLRVNIKMGTHDQVKIEIHWSMTKHKYPLWDTWPNDYTNTDICE